MDCKHVSWLVSQAQERRLPWRQRLALRLHLWMCAGCNRFARQLVLLREAVRHLGRRLEDDTAVVLPPEARDRIAARLNRQEE